MLVERMSRLADMDPEMQQEQEPSGCEFAHYKFHQLPDTKTYIKIKDKHIIHAIHEAIPTQKEEQVLPISDNDHQKLQRADMFCKNIISLLEKNKLSTGNPIF